jgi:cytochrome c oxidase subunit 2
MYSGALSATPPTVATWTFLFHWYLVFGATAAAVVIGALLYAVVRYRMRRGKAAPLDHKPTGWKVVLAIIVIMGVVLAGAGYQTFAAFSNINIPNGPGTVTIKVTGFQWGWNFTYPDGKYDVGILTVPVDKIVILNITSKDVYHAFGIAMLDVKEDAIPGKVNQLWFNMTETGTYVDAIRCYQLCGIGHAYMIGNLTVVSQAAWNATYGGTGG